MPKKRHKPEDIVAKLRQVDVLVSQEQSIADAIRSIGVTFSTVSPQKLQFDACAEADIRKQAERLVAISPVPASGTSALRLMRQPNAHFHMAIHAIGSGRAARAASRTEMVSYHD